MHREEQHSTTANKQNGRPSNPAPPPVGFLLRTKNTATRNYRVTWSRVTHSIPSASLTCMLTGSKA